MLRYTYIVCLVITETEIVYCAVRTAYLYTIQFYLRLSMVLGYGIRYFRGLKISDFNLLRCKNVYY